jgi:hypothetical protein
MTQWSEWTRHDCGEKPEHVPDDAEVDSWAWFPGDDTATFTPTYIARGHDWPHVLMYRYEIQPKVETVTIRGIITEVRPDTWRVYSDLVQRPNFRLTFETNDGVIQWDTLKAEPLE